MTLNETLIKRLEKSRAMMIEHLDEIDKNRKIYPLWTVREIVAHLSGWDDATIAYIRAVLAGGVPATPAARGMDVYNSETVATREGLSYDHIYREYIETRRVLLELIRNMPEEKITERYVLPWGEKGTLVDMINIFGPHEEVHAEDLRKLIEESRINKAAPGFNIRNYNREAWNRQVESSQNPWTKPVSPEVIARARNGDFAILLTENKPVPLSWFPPLKGADILCLASGGGQQGPTLAAAGANVTVFDNSPRQLEQDRFVGEREGLDIRLVEGDAADLSVFADESFDVVFNPCSTLFMKDVRLVWKEACRVLRHGGVLMTGLMNPIQYIFDLDKMDAGILEVKYSIPYADTEQLDKDELKKYLDAGLPVEFGHSLTDLLGGQCDAGFHIVEMYEDVRSGSALEKVHPSYIATRAIKP